MDDLFTFRWWYILVAFIVCFIVFGKRKGGVVKKRVTATLEILDDRFAKCPTEAKYSVFKKGSPDHIEIKVKELPISIGDELDFQINGKPLAKVKVNRKKAEFDYWSDEDVDFPVIKEGDELVIRHQGSPVLKGNFH